MLPVRAISRKVQRDCNETWVIDRWQYEEGQCTRTIILPSIFTQLSPHNHLFFIMDVCPSNIFEKYKRDCNETWFIDRWHWSTEESLCKPRGEWEGLATVPLFNSTQYPFTLSLDKSFWIYTVIPNTPKQIAKSNKTIFEGLMEDWIMSNKPR